MSVKLFKFDLKRVLLTILLALFFYWREWFDAGDNLQVAGAVIGSYFLAYILFLSYGKFKLWFRGSCVAFDLGGVYSTGDYLTEKTSERPGMRELVSGLKHRHIVALLSNQNSDAHKVFEKKFKLDERFDVQVVSGVEGVRKPSPEIYKILLKRAGVKPENCVFIDDMAENLEQPKKLGMKGIHFQSVQQVREELKKSGFL